jgi:ADP-heptose:LPS heptosyltransferase
MKSLIMQSMLRQVSLIGRKAHSVKDRRRVMRAFDEWIAVQRELSAVRRRDRTLLLIRLDEIGDYLLFRNQLQVYKASARWKSHRITLLGNEGWRELFTALDQSTVDDTIWVNKDRYLQNAPYRMEIWKQLRAGGFETVVAPSYMRPLLLDDLCMLAAAPLQSFASVNINVHECWNRLSDSLYTALFKPSGSLLMHEFDFNAEFSTWLNANRYPGNRPCIEMRPAASGRGAYTICFVGASIRSKRWPAKRWIEFIALHRRHFSGRIVLAAGSSTAELNMAHEIQQRTGAESVAGKLTLWECLQWIAEAQAVVTNDTMAAHMGVSLNRPTVIIANGTNYMRFSEYSHAGITQVAAVYSELFNRRRKRFGDRPYAYHETVTGDIVAIRAAAVIEALKELSPELCAGELSKEARPVHAGTALGHEIPEQKPAS